MVSMGIIRRGKGWVRNPRHAVTSIHDFSSADLKVNERAIHSFDSDDFACLALFDLLVCVADDFLAEERLPGILKIMV